MDNFEVDQDLILSRHPEEAKALSNSLPEGTEGEAKWFYRVDQQESAQHVPGVSRQASGLSGRALLDAYRHMLTVNLVLAVGTERAEMALNNDKLLAGEDEQLPIEALNDPRPASKKSMTFERREKEEGDFMSPSIYKGIGRRRED